MVSFALHIDELWVSVLIAIYYKDKDLGSSYYYVNLAEECT